jgi:hypothetical protein
MNLLIMMNSNVISLSIVTREIHIADRWLLIHLMTSPLCLLHDTIIIIIIIIINIYYYYYKKIFLRHGITIVVTSFYEKPAFCN